MMNRSTKLLLSFAVLSPTMTSLLQITPNPDQRGVIIGLSGCGKSNLAKGLLQTIPPKQLVVIDPKGEWQPEGYRVITDAYRLPKLGREPILYKPNVNQFADVKAYDYIFKAIYEHGHTTVYTDEASVFSTAIRYPHYLKAIYQQGRSKKIRAFTSTQRPSAIPPFLMSEATRLYAFYLTVPDDVKKVRSMLPGYDPDSLIQPYTFYYYNCLGTVRKGQIMKINGAL